MRESRKGRPPLVSIGYKGKNDKKKIFIVHNLKDMEEAKKYDVIILGKIGMRNKINILKKALEMKIDFQNINARKFLKKFEAGGKNESK